MLQLPIMDDSEPEGECFKMHSQSHYQKLPQNLYQLAAGPRDAVPNLIESPHQMPLDPGESHEKNISDSINNDENGRELDFSWLVDFPTISHHTQSEEHEGHHSPMLVDTDRKWTTSPQRGQSDCPQQSPEPQVKQERTHLDSARQQQKSLHEHSLLAFTGPSLLTPSAVRNQYESTDYHQTSAPPFEQTPTKVSSNWHFLQHPQSLHDLQSGEFWSPSSRPRNYFGSPPSEDANLFPQPPRPTYPNHTHNFQNPVAQESLERINERDVDGITSLTEDCKCSKGRDCKDSRPSNYGPWSNEIKTWDQANALLRSTTWTPPQPDATIPQSDAGKLMWAKRLYNAIIDFKHVHDKRDGKKKNYLLQGIYSQREIELACWNAVAVAVDLHTRGACLSRAADPTQDSHQDWAPNTRKEARRLNFEDRLKQVCWWLRVEKAYATNIINGIEVSKVIYAPKQMGKSKGDNRYGNEKKRSQINVGKSKAIIQEDEECAMTRSENEFENLPDTEPSEENNVEGETAEPQVDKGLKVETACSFGRLHADSPAQNPKGEKGKRRVADANDSDEVQAIERQRGSYHTRVTPARRAQGRDKGK